MTGSRIATATNMTASVKALLDASQTVSPCEGCVDEGMRKGKSATPAVRIVAATLTLVARNALPARRAPSQIQLPAAPATASNGRSHSSAWSR